MKTFFQKCLHFWLSILSIYLIGCTEEKTVIQQVAQVTYEIDSIDLYSSNIDKTRQKSDLQFISILYSNLFNASIPSNILNDLSQLRLSLGDKQLASEMMIDYFISNPAVIIPTTESMRNEPNSFIINTYLRFLQRAPKDYEVYALEKLIAENELLTSKEVYRAFTLSNEYQFY